MRATYDPVLVIASYLIAALASYCALAISERIRETEDRNVIYAWLATGSTAMGGGTWAMHFLAMLAFDLPVPVNYDLSITLISIIPAIFGSGIALHVASQPQLGGKQLLVSGLFMGVGIGVMHYTGMAAMRMNAIMQYSMGLFLLSIFVSFILSVVALYVNKVARSYNAVGVKKAMFGSALIMGLAVAGMHYTAMTAAYFFPTDQATGVQALFDPLLLGLFVGLTAVVIIVLAIIVTVFDSRVHMMKSDLHTTRQRMLDAIESISDGFVIFDNKGELVVSNSSLQTIYPDMEGALDRGTSYEEFARRWALQQEMLPGGVSVDEYVRGQIDTLFSTGRLNAEREFKDRWLYVKENKTEGGDIVGVWSDITKFKEMQRSLEKLAHHDPLTGLPNRTLFHDRLDRASSQAKRHGGAIAFMFLDLDGFKPINDVYGHESGDLVLKEVALRLNKCTRETDTVARLGGDEFGVILEPRVTRETTEVTARRMLAVLSDPILIGDRSCTVGVSIGISMYPADTENLDTLVKNADEAMYEVKKSGRNNIRFFQ